MKKAIAMLAALTICCTALTACGSSDSKSNGSASKSGKGAKNKSESSFTLGEDGEEMPVAAKVYKAKKGETRFLDILNQIADEEKITITQGSEGLTFARDVKGEKYLHATDEVIGNRTEYNMGTAWWFSTYELLEKNKDRKEDFGGLLVNLENMTKTYRYARGWYENGEQYCLNPLNYPVESIPEIPQNLSPEKWSFVFSGEDTINGNDYYCETYSVSADVYSEETEEMSDKEEMSINVLFDSNGDVAFMGSAVPYTVQESEDYFYSSNTGREICVPIAKLFYDAWDKTQYHMNCISLCCFTAYGEYTEISIKPEYNDAYSLDNFTMVEDIEEFASRSDTKEEIYDDLGL